MAHTLQGEIAKAPGHARIEAVHSAEIILFTNSMTLLNKIVCLAHVLYR